MIYPQNVIEEVRMNNDIVDVISESVQLKPQSGGYVGLCPFHHEKTPSFRVNGRDQYFHCFGCGESGDVISFVMKTRGYAFSDALKYLADRVHYPLPEPNAGADYKKTAEERQTLYEINKKAARYFYDCLQSNEGYFARQYLDNRRITQKARAVYGLGYAPYKSGGCVDFLTKQGYSREIILKSGLGTEGKNGRLRDKFFGRLMFPIIDIHNRFIGFGGRVFDDSKPKYLNSPETPVFNKSSNLYSMNLALKERSRQLILVEGYMDVIALWQSGFKTAVAALGTSFNENHTRLLKKYADRVIILFDSDEAGVKAVLRAIPVIEKVGIEAMVLQVKNAKDPDEYIKKFGREAFAELLKQAVPQVEFRLSLQKQGKDLSDMHQRIDYMKQAAKVISTIDNEMERDLYAKALAEETGVDPDSVKDELKKTDNAAVIPPPVFKRAKTSEKGANSGLKSAKKGIINIISVNPSVYDKIKDSFKGEYLNDEFLEGLYDIVTGFIEKKQPVVPAEIINYYEETPERDRCFEILRDRENIPQDKRTLEKNINDYIKTVLASYYNEKINKEKDIDKIKELIEKKRSLTTVRIKL
ncbi:MAG: DNA primase [Eubacterium sp.]|nr:DNA primase [Eubacterium sp.]